MDPDRAAEAELEFSVPIYDIEVALENREAVIARLLELRRVDDGLERSNLGGWHSAPQLHASDDRVLRSVIDRAAKLSELFLRGTGELDAGRTLNVDACWATINDAHDWNAPHSHHGNDWSAVLYLSVPEVDAALDGRIIFIDPLGRRHGHPTMCSIAPVAGHVLLFPAELVHLVAPHAAPTTRISLAFNFDVV